ncbi:MAG: hypothetical protein GYB40_04050 [Vibrionaceae bacterium]|nr:hypothetical protein [Vibrionaceae bacterium]
MFAKYIKSFIALPLMLSSTVSFGEVNVSSMHYWLGQENAESSKYSVTFEVTLRSTSESLSNVTLTPIDTHYLYTSNLAPIAVGNLDKDIPVTLQWSFESETPMKKELNEFMMVFQGDGFDANGSRVTFLIESQGKSNL